MALTSTTSSPKFLRLIARLDKIFPPAVVKGGLSVPLALGLLECLWQFTHSIGNPVYAPDDVEPTCRWTYKPGLLLESLLDVGFMDRREDGRVEVHDYWVNAPEFVIARRRMREKRATARANPKPPQKTATAAPPPMDTPPPLPNVPNSSEQFQTVRAEREREREKEREVDQSADPSLTDGVGDRARATGGSVSGRRSCASSEAAGPQSAGQLLQNMGLAPALGPPAPAPPAMTGNAPVHAVQGPGRQPCAAPPPSRAAPRAPTPPPLNPAQQARVDQLTKLVLPVAAEGPEYIPWWKESCALAVRHGEGCCVEEAVRYARDCANPAVRSFKDLGELKRPGAYIAGQLQERLKDHGVRLPPPPRVAASVLN